MSAYYRSLRDNPPEKPKKEGHKGNWSLFFYYLGKRQDVLIDKPYSMCKDAKQRLERTRIANIGRYVIEPHKPTK